MQISFLWRLASMRSQKDCCGLHISLFTADVGLAVHLHLTTFLLLWSLSGVSELKKSGIEGAKR